MPGSRQVDLGMAKWVVSETGIRWLIEHITPPLDIKAMDVVRRALETDVGELSTDKFLDEGFPSICYCSL